MARPRKKIDPEQVRALAGIGCTHEEIAAVLKCSADTLTRRFADDLKEGKEHAKASLRRMQWEAAKKGNVTMMIWLGKQMLGQRDYQRLEHSGEIEGSMALAWKGAIRAADSLLEPEPEPVTNTEAQVTH